MSNGFSIAMPAPPTYGAVEIKEYIRKNTYRALVYTLSFFLLLFLFYWVYGLASENRLDARTVLPLAKH